MQQWRALSGSALPRDGSGKSRGRGRAAVTRALAKATTIAPWPGIPDGVELGRRLVGQPAQRDGGSALDVVVAWTPDAPQLRCDPLQKRAALLDRQGPGRGHHGLKLSVAEPHH